VPENVDLVRRGFELFAGGGPAALLPLTDPEIECYTDSRLPNAGTYHGHDGYLSWTQQWLEAWEDFQMEPLEFVEVGEEIVVVPLHQRGKGKGSGIEVEMDLTYLFEGRDGRVTHIHLYETKERALEVARELAPER